MAFHSQYFDREVPNSSECYDYYEWNKTNRRELPSGDVSSGIVIKVTAVRPLSSTSTIG